MGRWTFESLDDVLGAKMKSLVSGAIKRSRLEIDDDEDDDGSKTEPIITYQTFVEELSTGDSFTASIIEVLVKEVAERRLREPAERGLIADRTMRSLRRLSSPAMVYRPRNHGRRPAGRTGIDIAEHVVHGSDDLYMGDDDDEVVATYIPIGEERESRPTASVYGVQSHRRNPLIPSPFRSLLEGRPGTESNMDRVLPPLRQQQESESSSAPVTRPATSSSGWVPSPSAMQHTHPLSRQLSARRATRSRTADFSEFTSRRRNTTRLLAEADEEEEGSASRGAVDTDSTPIPESPWLPSWHRPSSPGVSGPSLAPLRSPPPPQPQARHFFPFARRFEMIPPGGPRPADWTFQAPVPSAEQYSTMMQDNTVAEHETSEERSQAPRLRRGGLRAPESMLSRHASPATRSDVPPLIENRRSDQPEGDGAGVGGATPADTRSVSEEIIQSIG